MSRKDNILANARSIRGLVQTLGFHLASQANVEVVWPSPLVGGNWAEDILAEQDATLRSLVMIQRVVDEL